MTHTVFAFFHSHEYAHLTTLTKQKKKDEKKYNSKTKIERNSNNNSIKKSTTSHRENYFSAVKRGQLNQ